MIWRRIKNKVFHAPKSYNPPPNGKWRVYNENGRYISPPPPPKKKDELNKAVRELIEKIKGFLDYLEKNKLYPK